MVHHAAEGLCLRELAEALEDGRIRAEALAEATLAGIAGQAAAGTGPAFVHVDETAVRVAARAADEARRKGRAPSPFCGIPFSVKDLFDVAGEVTTAGSVILRDRPPARRDAPVVAALRRAGLIPCGRTNMTEFAYSGLGLNAHHGTPAAVTSGDEPLAPGGSSSGAAISVAAGIVPLALGSDTGGSCRVPAAFNRIAGFKPSHGRLPGDGLFPLAPSFDDPGPLAACVADLAAGLALMEGRPDAALRPLPVPAPGALRLAVPRRGLALEDLEPAVAEGFERALDRLSAAGVRLIEADMPMPDIRICGALSAHEAWGVHRDLMARKAHLYDPRVRRRLEAAARVRDDQARELARIRAEMIAAFRLATARTEVQAWLLPTTPLLPPPLAALEADMDRHDRCNLMSLRNTFMGNFLDACAVSLPAPGPAASGIMLMAPHGADDLLLACAAAVEDILGSSMQPSM
jgi:aspartyl-tRNA(Asn)/glutamyl-tRNA(Gln) amidotransferase subunit A